MRPTVAFFLCLTFTAICLVLLQQHLQVLHEVARTYATFHSYVRRHKEIVYTYPALTNQTNAGAADQVPRIIHQVSLTGKCNASLFSSRETYTSCLELHPGWQYMLWTDENATAFIREHYPTLAPHYEGYAHTIQRANSLRYALLHHYGGVYLDLDITCLRPLDNLLHLPFLTPAAHPAGVNNAFILARPGHCLLSLLLDRLPEHDLKWPTPYAEDMLVAGTMVFSNVWMEYMHFMSQRSDLSDDRVVCILADEDGKLGPHMLRGKVTTPLFSHGGASTWHGWDAWIILFIGKHCVLCSVLASSSVLCISVVLFRLGCSWASRSRRRSTSATFTTWNGTEVKRGEV